ncbi:MAG: hypothetical protein ACI9OJ_005820 [Myxococcota bacterium]|jgi:hypothetical protein
MTLALGLFGCSADDTDVPETAARADVGASVLDVVVPIDAPGTANTTDSSGTPDAGERVDINGTSDAGPAAPTPLSLVDMYAFDVCPNSDDPWFKDAKEKATDAQCTSAAWMAETIEGTAWFDVATSGCAYLTVRQSLRLPLQAGDQVKVELFYSLITAGVAPYLLAIGLGDPGAEVWRTEITFIPATQQTVTSSFTADRDYAAGETVYFHVSNHGSNIWALIALEKSPSATAPQ